MNKFLRYPVKTRWRLITVLLCMMMCGLAGVVRVGPPLWRAVNRSLRMRKARVEWRSIMQGTDPTPESPVCNLEIPAVDIDLPVLAYSSKVNLSRLPCISTVCPDRDKAPVIVAHRDLHFRGLQGVEKGDRVYLSRRSGERVEYRIMNVYVVQPEEAACMASSAHAGSLTLITCYPFRYIGAAPERFIVICKRI